MRVIGMIFNIYISNRIGSEAVGVFTLVMSVYLFFVTIATSGLSMAVTCILPEEFSKRNYAKVLLSIRTCIFLASILGIFSGIIICVFSSNIISMYLHNFVSNNVLYLIAIGLPFIAMSSCINGYFSARRKSYKTALVQVSELLVKIIMTIIFLSQNISKGVEFICISLILADVISEVFSFTLLFILYCKDKRNFSFYNTKQFGNYKKIWKISFPIAITSYIRSGLSTLKQLIIPSQLEKYGLSCSLSLSYYGIISGMIIPVLVFPSVFLSSFSILLIPEFSSYLANGNKKSIEFLTNKILFIISIFSFIIASFYFMFSNQISMFVYQSIEYAKWFKLLSPLIFFMYIDNILDSILKGLNKQFGVMCCNIFDLVSTIIIIYFLLPLFGINGYIFSIIFSELINFIISFIQLYKAVNIKKRFLLFFFIVILISLFVFVTNF